MCRELLIRNHRHHLLQFFGPSEQSDFTSKPVIIIAGDCLWDFPIWAIKADPAIIYFN